jgi:hypothetical protein
VPFDLTIVTPQGQLSGAVDRALPGSEGEFTVPTSTSAS